jgi:hypothetical protein
MNNLHAVGSLPAAVLRLFSFLLPLLSNATHRQAGTNNEPQSCLAMLSKDLPASAAVYALIDWATTGGFINDDEIYTHLNRPDVQKHSLFSGQSAWTLDNVSPCLDGLTGNGPASRRIYPLTRLGGRHQSRDMDIHIIVDARAFDARHRPQHPSQILKHPSAEPNRRCQEQGG